MQRSLQIAQLELDTTTAMKIFLKQLEFLRLKIDEAKLIEALNFVNGSLK